MPKFILTFVFLSCFLSVYAQPPPPPVYSIVDKMPSFPGGEVELIRFLQKNIRYPAFARENNITGTVFLTFVVDIDGTITEMKILKGVAEDIRNDLANEALRVVSQMPQWTPGSQDGNAVKVQYNLPIRFSLKGNRDETAAELYEKGNRLYKDGQYEAALSVYDRSLNKDSININVLFNRAVCYIKLGKNEEACADFKAAAGLGDKQAEEMLGKYCK